MMIRSWFAAVLLFPVGASTAPTLQQPAPADTVSRTLRLAGRVLEPGGAPASGAVVVSSAGGSAVTGADGRFQLALERPPAATRLRVTAAAGADRAASVELALTPTAGRLDAGDLVLTLGSGCEPSWLPTFGAYPGALGPVFDLEVYDDGSGRGPALYVAAPGFATDAGWIWNVARWDGSRWQMLGTGLGGDSARCLAVFDDGTGSALYAGGSFQYAGGVPASRIAKWDGTAWSPLGSGIGLGRVSTLAVLDDGSGSGPALYVGGWFNTAGGINAASIARWDGSSWSALGGGIGATHTGGVHAIELFDDGSGPAIYAGGRFESAGGTATQNLARWDGSSWTPVGGGTNGWVHALRAHDDGAGLGEVLFVGGEFTRVRGHPIANIARWDGSAWSPVSVGMDDAVWGLDILDDGTGPRLHAAGQFTMAGAGPARGVARWDGTSWSPLGSGLTSDGARAVALSVWDDGSGPGIYVGGEFEQAGSAWTFGLARWDAGGWSGFSDGLPYPVGPLGAFDDGGGAALHAAGRFPKPNGGLHEGIARWEASDWIPVGGRVDDLDIRCMAALDDGSGPALYVGGGFTAIGGVPTSRIARWDGSSWSGLASGLNGPVEAICTFDDGTGSALYVAGAFSEAGGVPASNVAKWDGHTWSALGLGCNLPVYALATFDSGGREALYAGGAFGQAGGSHARWVARWDGQSWSGLGPELRDAVYALTVFDDGTGAALYAGGRFVDGFISIAHVAKWDGTAWSGLGDGLDGLVESLEVHDDGSGPALYAGGEFRFSRTTSVPYVARWDGASWSSLGSGLDDLCHSLLSFDGGDGPALYAAGEFGVSGGNDSYIAKWGCPGQPGTSYCSCDGSGSSAPCGNDGGAGEGCANSTGAGALLAGAGSPSVSADDLLFVATELLAGQPALLFVGDQRVNGGDGLPFGDGLRCAGSNVRRLGTETPDASGAASWGPGLATPGGFDAGETRRFQVWYRDPSGGPCASGFNLTNGYEVELVP